MHSLIWQFLDSTISGVRAAVAGGRGRSALRPRRCRRSGLGTDDVLARCHHSGRRRRQERLHGCSERATMAQVGGLGVTGSELRGQGEVGSRNVQRLELSLRNSLSSHKQTFL